jgi:hypothetical protein
MQVRDRGIKGTSSGEAPPSLSWARSPQLTNMKEALRNSALFADVSRSTSQPRQLAPQG